MNGRVLKHRNYQFLDDKMIDARFDGMGVTNRHKMSYDLIRDLANYHSHILMGEDPEKYLIKAKDIYKIENFSNEREYWERIAYHNNILNFIRQININIFSGNTPAQKAASVMVAISNINKEFDNSENDNKMMEYFKPTEEEINKAKEEEYTTDKEIQNDEKSDNEKKTKSDKGKQKDKDSKNGKENNSGAGGKGRVDRVRILEDLIKSTIDYAIESPISSEYFRLNSNIPEIALGEFDKKQLKIIEQLSIISKFGSLKVHKSNNKRIYGNIKDYGDVVNAFPKSQLLSPLFNINLIEKNIIVSKIKNKQKQVLIYLIDDSGSMAITEKISWVKTIMINRLDAVARGKAELFIAWYIEDIIPKSVVAVRNKEEAKNFSKQMFFGNFNGGNTNIQKSIESAVSCIKNRNFYGFKLNGNNEQIVIINDGQDYVNREYTLPNKIVLNSFILGQDNFNLKTITEKSGGSYVRFL